MVVEDSRTVSRSPRSAGDGWREITLLPIPRMRPPEPRTPRQTVATGSSAIGSPREGLDSSAIGEDLRLFGEEDVSSSSVSSFDQG
jgi:hypothetical protein